MKCCICGTIKNCAKYLDNIFKNMNKIGRIFTKCKIFLYYDHSDDNTLQKLYQYDNNRYSIPLYYYINNETPSPYRTYRIAKGRNKCLDFMKKNCSNYDFFIMMDCDDVCSKKIKIHNFKKYLKRNDWDALSFNKEDYYDIWALSIKPYVFSYAHFKEPLDMYYNMKNYINNCIEKLDKNELLECISAFNGFSIYRMNKFINCRYDGQFRLNLILDKLVNKSDIIYDEFLENFNGDSEDCEHRSFHVQAIIENKAKIYIAKDILF